METVKKWLPIFLLVIGIVAIVLGLGADLFNLGMHPGFGYQQIIIAVLGVVLVIVGIVLKVRWGK